MVEGSTAKGVGITILYTTTSGGIGGGLTRAKRVEGGDPLLVFINFYV